MAKWSSLGIWETVARIILRNKTLMICIILALTGLLATQWKNIHFTYNEANLLPSDTPASIEYQGFLNIFGEEGNLVLIGVKDQRTFTPKVYRAFSRLMQKIGREKEVSLVLSVDNLKTLRKNDSLQRFDFTKLVDDGKTSDPVYLKSVRQNLFHNLPFYENLLFNEKSGTIRSAVYLDKTIVNTPVRRDFVLQKLIPAVEAFEKETGVDLKVSGMPYIRTMSTETIKSEIGIFIGSSLLVTSLLFFFFFRSFRATMISLLIVVLGVMWSFGILGLFHYEITVLTALVPSLIVVIAVPNCIFLTNKYHQEYQHHRNKVRALQRVITKIGMSTMMTNVITAIGFATFIASNNKLLVEFGAVTSVNIMAMFFISLVIIPVFHSYIPPPTERHLRHLSSTRVKGFLDWILRGIQENRFSIYCVSILLLVISIIGIYKMRVSGSIIEDMPKSTDFFKDISFFEKEFDGVMPLEIMIDTKRKKGVMKMSTISKMDRFEDAINEIPQLSRPISVVSLIKYAKQSYYNGNPEYYELPTPQEQPFILSYAKNAVKSGGQDMMKSYVDATGRYARITTFLTDERGDKVPVVEAEIRKQAEKIFPADRFKVTVTGKTLIFQKGTQYLLSNLMSSLLFAVFLTGLLMAFMFRSFKMVVVSLIPNLLPLLMTAGIMGFLDIPLKASTILVFGIAFGLSIDDTIRFLAQYREELRKHNWKIRRSVFAAFNEAGLSMFYTSIVLFFGFSVFLLSQFGGTKALGGLVALTLFCGMLSNLMLLPALVLTLNKKLANEQEMPAPGIDIIQHSDEDIDNMPGHRELE